MCANEVQFQLQPAFIDGLKKRNPAQFEEYIKSGSIIANQDGTYSSADAKFRTVAANGVFSAASVEGAGGVKETKTLDSATPAKGLGVEHSAAKAKEGVKEEKTVTFKLDDFVKQSGLAEDKRAELVKEFEIPENFVPVSILPIGYPKEGIEPNPLHYERKDLSETVFYNKF